MAKWRTGSFVITTMHGKAMREGYIREPFGVARDPKNGPATVTHLPSGRAVGHFDTIAKAKAFGLALADDPRWLAMDRPDPENPEHVAAVADLARAYMEAPGRWT